MMNGKFLLSLLLVAAISSPFCLLAENDSLITTSTYQNHFKYLATSEGESRKVIASPYQEEGHEKAKNYIDKRLKEYCNNNVYFDQFSWDDFQNLGNVIGIQYGTNPEHSGILLIGAHYDSNNNRGPGIKNTIKGAPGANDNASGIAAMLEIARVLKDKDIEPTIIYGAWDLEERFFKGHAIGSYNWAKKYLTNSTNTDHDNINERTLLNISDIICNINIDMIGRINNKDSKIPQMWTYSGIKEDEIFATNYTKELNKLTDKFEAKYKGSIRYSDHFTFASMGIPSIEHAEADLFNDVYYHTYADNIDNKDNVDYEYSAAISNTILKYILKQYPSQTSPDRQTLFSTNFLGDTCQITTEDPNSIISLYDKNGSLLIQKTRSCKQLITRGSKYFISVYNKTNRMQDFQTLDIKE